MSTDDLFFKRKESLVIKDFETAFKCYEHLGNKVSTIRQWTVTLMIAMIGFSLIYHVSLFNMIFLSGACLASFLLCELRERSSMKYDKNEILLMEKMFMESDNEKYANGIISYKFRDLKLLELSRKEKCLHLWASLRKPIVAFWYTSWILVWVIIVWTSNPVTIRNKPVEKVSDYIESVTKKTPVINEINQTKEVNKEGTENQAKKESPIKSSKTDQINIK
jgi:hypothetical protein